MCFACAGAVRSPGVPTIIGRGSGGGPVVLGWGYCGGPGGCLSGGSPPAQLAEELEVVLVFRSASSLLHDDQVVERGEPGEGLTQSGSDAVGPYAVKTDPLDERMDVRFDEILTNENLVGQELVNGDVGDVITECLQGRAGAFGVGAFGLNEDVDVQCGPRIAVDRKGGGPNDDEPDPMLF